MKTIALVIGNNTYNKGYELENAENDAIEIAKVLERLNITVILKTNCNTNNITEILTQFEEQIAEYDASIFYFAGHGFEINGENYLAGTECQIGNIHKSECNRSCIRLQEMMDIYKDNNNKIHIAIIDACRKSFDRSGSIGYSPIQAPQGTLIAFSTSPNEGASDVGFEGHSIFTGAMLKYIGRENLSVEDLFKKVRKTVFNLTEGRQTTWEHTSLIGDYYFNTGQIVHSPNIPYDEKVVKDKYYENSEDDFGYLITTLKSYDWNQQNPAIYNLIKSPLQNLDKNQQFLLGRNLLQASGNAVAADNFMNNIAKNISPYSFKEENHLLNGILFEIYFDSIGEFRKEKTKMHNFENIIKLRKNTIFSKSFEFIAKLLKAMNWQLIYIPENIDLIIDIDIIANEEKYKYPFGDDKTCQAINSVVYNGLNITESISKFNYTHISEDELKEKIAILFTAPINLIQINCGIDLNDIVFKKNVIEDNVFDW